MQSLGVFIGNVKFRIGVAFTFPAITPPFLNQFSKSWCLLKTRDQEDSKTGIRCPKRPHNSWDIGLQSKRYFFCGHPVNRNIIERGIFYSYSQYTDQPLLIAMMGSSLVTMVRRRWTVSNSPYVTTLQLLADSHRWTCSAPMEPSLTRNTSSATGKH